MDMKRDTWRGFTLVEMLVVIAIIGILATIVLSSVKQAREAGYTAQCRANLRNLATGIQILAAEGGGIRLAYGGESTNLLAELPYSEFKGWVNWVPSASATAPRPTWPNIESQIRNGEMEQPPWFGAKGLRGIKDGTLWADGGVTDLSAYICPRFKRKAVCGKTDAVRSYAMNKRVGGGGLQGFNMSRTMLFAEIPVPASGVALTAANGGDTCLDAEGSPPSGTYVKPYETIGFHHRYAGVACGHVVFVGGNVEVAHMWVTNTPTLMTNNPTLGLAKGEL
jgi:prepilin-type N-terminal cleavage/methylation domain-containing protein